MVDVLTDNRNRTGAEIRNLFSKNGGSMAEPGAVAWQFDRKGQIIVPRAVDEEELMLTALDAGAEDIVDDGDSWRVTTPPTELHAVRTALDEGGIPIDSSDLTMVPQATVPLDTAESAKKVLRLMDALDEHDDVQGVHANFDIPDAILETVES
jgi:YebC/PmpR family DNA-binding regulatory protein